MGRIKKAICIVPLLAVMVACGNVSSTPKSLETATLVGITTTTNVPIVVTPTPVSTISVLTITPTNVVYPFQLEDKNLGRQIGNPRYSHDNKWLFLPTTAGVFVLEVTSYQAMRLLPYVPRYLNDIVLSPDEKILAFEYTLISVADGQELSSPKIAPSVRIGTSYGTINDIKFSPDSKLLAVTYYAGQLDFWRMEDSKLIYSLEAESVVFSPNSELIAAGSDLDKNPHIGIYETQTGNLLKDWVGKRAEFLNDNHLAVETNNAVRIYDLTSGKVPYAFSGKYVAFSPDEQLVALLNGAWVEIYQVATGKLLYRLGGDLNNVDYINLRFAPDSQTLLGYAYWSFCCAGWQHKLSLWRVDNGALIKEVRTFYDYDFSPDGNSLAITSNNGLQILNTLDGSVRIELKEITIP